MSQWQAYLDSLEQKQLKIVEVPQVFKDMMEILNKETKELVPA